MLEEIHQLTHWGTQGLCDHFLRENLCLGVYDLARVVTKGCVLCQKVNQKTARKIEPGGRELALRPFQNVQIDFTKIPPVQKFKHFLVIIDHLTHWVEAFPTTKETTDVLVKILLEQVFPQYVLTNTTDSDRGLHFTAQILHQVVKALGIKWRLRTPWHPQSSGRVECMNKTIKNVITKLVEEIQSNWLKCLPLALLHMRTRPRADMGVSPCETFRQRVKEKWDLKAKVIGEECTMRSGKSYTTAVGKMACKRYLIIKDLTTKWGPQESNRYWSIGKKERGCTYHEGYGLHECAEKGVNPF